MQDHKKKGKYESDEEYLLDHEQTGSTGKDVGFLATVVRPCVAECFGVMLFVFIGGMSISSGTGVVTAAIAHGFAIFGLVASLGHISGGHFNPAVSLGFVLCDGMSPLLALFYVISQCLGGIVGAACIKAAVNNATYMGMHGAANVLNEGSATPGMAIMCETMTTAALVSVILGAAIDSTGRNILAPLAIGGTVMVDIMATAHISGASMNPARSLGPALIAGFDQPEIWTYQYINWLGPLLGTLLAVIMYRALFASFDKRLFKRKETRVTLNTQ